LIKVVLNLKLLIGSKMKQQPLHMLNDNIRFALHLVTKVLQLCYVH